MVAYTTASHILIMREVDPEHYSYHQIIKELDRPKFWNLKVNWNRYDH